MTTRPARRMRAVFAGSAVALVSLLGVVTWLGIMGEKAHAHAEADVRFQEDVRAALWRMESRVGSMLSLTVGTLGSEVGVFSNRIEVGSNSLGAQTVLPEPIEERAQEAADQAYLMACGLVEDGGVEQTSQAWIATDFQRRNDNVGQVQNYAPRGAVERGGPEPSWTIGPSAPIWYEEAASDEPAIILARRIESPFGVSHRADVLDWSEVRDTLIAEVGDVFPDARLVRADGGEDGFRLAALPVSLALDESAERASRLDLARLRSLGLALGASWVALLGALGFGWVALRASVAYGDKHRRFTHAVTHELRTPLTTFRMYSEMLSRGMVPPDAAPEYLGTLERESARLSGLVENVLRYARLEEDADAAEASRVASASLLARVRPDLERICAGHGASLLIVDAETNAPEFLTDPDAVAQILGNLVENACKYGDAAAGGVTLETTSRGFDVVDRGPGLPGRAAKVAFEPFDRAGRDSSDPMPGVGLGLALSRDLARALGGDLALAPPRVGEGARFRLELRPAR